MALKKILVLTGTFLLQTQETLINFGESSKTITVTVRVKTILGGKETAKAVVEFTDGAVNFTKDYTFDVSVADGAPNHIKQAYSYLKSLPEFEGAEDC